MENNILFEIDTLQDWQAETAADQVLAEETGGCNNCNAGDEP
jgi:hypothetical protein